MEVFWAKRDWAAFRYHGLFHLTDENKLPYKGLNRVSAYLLVCTETLQLMMYHNFKNNINWGDTTTFRTCF